MAKDACHVVLGPRTFGPRVVSVSSLPWGISTNSCAASSMSGCWSTALCTLWRVRSHRHGGATKRWWCWLTTLSHLTCLVVGWWPRAARPAGPPARTATVLAGLMRRRGGQCLLLVAPLQLHVGVPTLFLRRIPGAFCSAVASRYVFVVSGAREEEPNFGRQRVELRNQAAARGWESVRTRSMAVAAAGRQTERGKCRNSQSP